MVRPSIAGRLGQGKAALSGCSAPGYGRRPTLTMNAISLRSSLRKMDVPQRYPAVLTLMRMVSNAPTKRPKECGKRPSSTAFGASDAGFAPQRVHRAVRRAAKCLTYVTSIKIDTCGATPIYSPQVQGQVTMQRDSDPPHVSAERFSQRPEAVFRLTTAILPPQVSPNGSVGGFCPCM